MSLYQADFRKRGDGHTLSFTVARTTERGTEEWRFCLSALGLLMPAVGLGLFVFLLALSPDLRWPSKAAPAPAEAAPGLAHAETGTLAAPGQPFGAPEEVITPLNVRDPSALVMGPYSGPVCSCPR